MNFWSRIIGNY